MGNTITWQETAEASLAQMAIALQPHHRARLDMGECYALACILRQQLSLLPGNVVETAIMTDLIERLDSRPSVRSSAQPAQPAHRAFLAAVPA